jgi:acyl transferase domain-containing protein
MARGCSRQPGSHAQALSPVGRCKTFDVSADGYGRGEGCVVTVLERRPPGAAPALAVLAGSAINQDGRSSSLTAPNGPSQAALVRGVLDRAGGPGRRDSVPNARTNGRACRSLPHRTSIVQQFD